MLLGTTIVYGNILVKLVSIDVKGNLFCDKDIKPGIVNAIVAKSVELDETLELEGNLALKGKQSCCVLFGMIFSFVSGGFIISGLFGIFGDDDDDAVSVLGSMIIGSIYIGMVTKYILPRVYKWKFGTRFSEGCFNLG